ncbi:hypothetical protein K437DRAFT_296968 [Tilletiaria anomala UBC 951]|uniref:Uncharacterized protein n=1 Tax=Tilletiaria anomala (strain ATCC 24038 / CBS 436.72 / UBC 951) TaxID=1037660 RepID=A0A066V9N8_TILAU|nr:uncharacterized protein K437DRAFT_296968 [Tilletiaria anomala UBC 951]KDN35295.1 hypothetical protein K437DRAFT_296968 [Tilletiaria anomala UBC 951]
MTNTSTGPNGPVAFALTPYGCNATAADGAAFNSCCQQLQDLWSYKVGKGWCGLDSKNNLTDFENCMLAKNATAICLSPSPSGSLKNPAGKTSAWLLLGLTLSTALLSMMTLA